MNVGFVRPKNKLLDLKLEHITFIILTKKHPLPFKNRSKVCEHRIYNICASQIVDLILE